ncbi:LLM class flavin-dependent oxidoreductase [Thermogemmatispora sp.]|uniref:LLM class flavin-dependent oxidoreductase n=1 Tax=Thermogemmatispora sp. TaxID=1968838 RepID=UPI001D677211|nr:LLM class flavin-dependent oxidoreductase [Thermogemmatispora sp.]MBX5450559.1 LLM class flavin-dependent oxidoreductase [Thermogemmatispora sp.]
MKIGIGLPASIPGVDPGLVLEWARRAEQGPFVSLGLIDRLVYPNLEPMITLGAVAAVTSRIRLMTTVLLAPLRNTAILAKEAATLDAYSRGRLTLGLGIGAREDDFQAAGVPFHRRGKIFDEQLALMKRIWSGEPLSAEIGPIGPKPVRPGGPEVLLGGYSPAAIRRLARWGDGFIAGGSAPDQAGQFFRLAEQVWQEAGKPGRPRLVGSVYYGLGRDAVEKADAYLSHYYAFAGPRAHQMAHLIPTTPEAIRRTVQTFAEAGADELMLWATIPELEQIDLLAEAVAGLQL